MQNIDLNLKLNKVLSGGSRISHGAPTPKGVPTYYFANFSRKLYKMNKFLAWGGGVHVSLAPHRSANRNFCTYHIHNLSSVLLTYSAQIECHKTSLFIKCLPNKLFFFLKTAFLVWNLMSCQSFPSFRKLLSINIIISVEFPVKKITHVTGLLKCSQTNSP